jgi:hypothetical protein
MMQLTRMLAGVTVLTLAILLPAAALAAECKAEVRARPRSDEVYDSYIDKVFAVELDTTEACAKVYVDFHATERLFNGEVIKTTKRGFRKTTASGTYKVKYRIERDSKLMSWEFKVNKCVVCGTE